VLLPAQLLLLLLLLRLLLLLLLLLAFDIFLTHEGYSSTRCTSLNPPRITTPS
jgi:hypothetical protein